MPAPACMLDRWMRDPKGARELGWAGGWDSDAGAERAVRRRVVGSVGVVSGRGGGSEEADTGVSLPGRCVRDPEGARELGWAGGWLWEIQLVGAAS